jgi:hypothetical protein
MIAASVFALAAVMCFSTYFVLGALRDVAKAVRESSITAKTTDFESFPWAVDQLGRRIGEFINHQFHSNR